MRTPSSIRLQPLPFVAGLFCLVTAMPLTAQAISGQKTFSSSNEAIQALLVAAKSGDPAQLEPLLGPQAPELIAAGDAGSAKELLAGFVKAYSVKHSLSVEAQGFEYLQVGSSDWPFPFPIVRDGKVWYFDVDRGNQEILDRRIGRDELGAIAVCEGYVQSQVEYGSKGRDGNPRAPTRSDFTAIQANKMVSTGPFPKASPRARWARQSPARLPRNMRGNRPKAPSPITVTFIGFSPSRGQTHPAARKATSWTES